MTPFYRLLLASFLSFSLLAACSKSPSPDAVALNMMQHLAAGDFEKAKTHTTGEARMQLEVLTLLAKGKSAVPAGTEYEILEKKIEGDTAVVRINTKNSPESGSMQVFLKKDKEKGWLIEKMK